MANELIQIDGDYARLFRQTAEGMVEDRRVYAASLFEKLNQSSALASAMATPLLPLGSKSYFRRDSREVLVYEQMPQSRTIQASSGEWYQISLPFMVYVFYLDHGHLPSYKSRVFFRNSALTSLSDSLSLCALTHVYTGDGGRPLGSICLEAAYDNEDPIEKKIIASLEYFWNTQFKDYKDRTFADPHFFRGMQNMADVDNRVANLASWAKHSSENALFALEVPWIDAGVNVQQAIDQAFALRNADAPNKIDNVRKLADAIYRLEEV